MNAEGPRKSGSEKTPPASADLTPLSREAITAQILDASKRGDKETVERLKGLLEREQNEKPKEGKEGLKEIKIDNVKNIRLLVRKGEHYIIENAKNAMIAVEPGGKLTLSAKNANIFQSEGAEVKATFKSGNIIRGERAEKAVKDFQNLPGVVQKRVEKQKRIKDGTEKSETPTSLSREELAQKAIEAKDPEEVRKINEAIARVESEAHAKGPPTPEETQNQTRDQIVNQIREAARKGDIKEVHRLNALLSEIPPEGPLRAAAEIQQEKAGGERAGKPPEEKDPWTEVMEKREFPTAEEIWEPQRVAAEKERRRKELEAKPANEAESRFTNAFNIPLAEIRKMPGYGELSPGQQ